MFCIKCKKEIPNDSIFCIFCGYEIKGSLFKGEKSGRKDKLYIIFLSLLVILLITSTSILIYFINQKKLLSNSIANLQTENQNYKDTLSNKSNEVINLENENSKIKSELSNTKIELNNIYTNIKDIPIGKVTLSIYGSSNDIDYNDLKNILGEKIGMVTVEKWKGDKINYYTTVLLKISTPDDYNYGTYDLILVSTSNLITTDNGENFISYLKRTYNNAIIDVAKNNTTYVVTKKDYSFNVFVTSVKVRNWWLDSMVIQVSL